MIDSLFQDTIFTFFMNLTIGIFGSIAATIIIFFLGKFYNYNSKERIMYQIELALIMFIKSKTILDFHPIMK